jgi:serine/threonine protein phosphatase 1
MSRLLAIGDVHGCSRALDLLLADVCPRGDDKIVTLGDHIDRGPDTKGVLDRLLDLHRAGRLIPLRGNHEMMLLKARRSPTDQRYWLGYGGDQTLESYRVAGRPATLDDIPERHWQFVEEFCSDIYEGDTHFFVHANVLPDRPFANQPTHVLHWQPFVDRGPHCSGKVMVCGHTEQQSGVPLNVGHAVCLDTWVYGQGWLTCLDVASGQIWQANQRGQRRGSNLNDYLDQETRT